MFCSYRLSDDEVEMLVAFIKMHERVAIPDDIWELCLKLQEYLEIGG